MVVLWVGLGVGVGCACAEQPDKLPQPTSYVSDFAGVVDAGSKQQMEDLCKQVYDKAGATIEVVTVKSLDGMAIEDFTSQLEDKWKVGAKGTDKGVILLFAIQDRKRRIEVGRGLEGVLNDAKVGDIGRSLVPLLQAGQYGPAMLSGVRQVGQDIAQDANVTLDLTPVQHSYHREVVVPQRHGHGWISIVILVVFLFLLFRGGGRGGGSGWMWFLLGNMMGGGFGGGRGGGFGGGGGGGGGDSDGGGGNFGGGFGGGSDGGGASGDW